jgi:hypothetical protein
MDRIGVVRELMKAARDLAAGGSDFYTFGRGSDPKAIFRELVEDARHESGHGGYTGTIAEKDGFKVVSKPLLKDEARKFANREAGKNDKWGPAWAIPVSEGGKVIGYMFFGMASS